MNGNGGDEKLTSAHSFKSIDSFRDVETFLTEKVIPSYGRVIAVALSGGADSTALCHYLSDKAESLGGIEIHALIVDHGIRDNSAEEAAYVLGQATKFNVRGHILCLPPMNWESKIQEKARAARYKVLRQYCKDHKIRSLFTAHHMDDQAETLLFRLAKGSGLDGLSSMTKIQEIDSDLFLIRPFLGITKKDLIAYCGDHDLDFVKDPSNENDDFARVRLRKSRGVLEEEGLNTKRLCLTAQRLSRARDALDYFSEQALEASLFAQNDKSVQLEYDILVAQPSEIRFRVLKKAMFILMPDLDYGPRTEKLEALECDLFSGTEFKRRSLGRLLFSKNERAPSPILLIERE